MGIYTDVFVAPVPRKNLEAYRDHAMLAYQVWRDHGALSCIELEADDVKSGKLTSFPQSVDLKPGEVVCIGIVTYESREHRDEVMARVMQDERMAGIGPESMPFDAMRMYWGGFKPLLEA